LKHFKIEDINSINSTSQGFIPIPTLEFRMFNGDVVSFPGFPSRQQAIDIINNLATQRGQSISIYSEGKRL